MSDNILPFDIQREIIKKVSDVKSLLQFRSVSKGWKSLIDSSDFIKAQTHPHTHILTYRSQEVDDDLRYNICLVDEDTFKVQQEFVVVPPLLQPYGGVSAVIGASHGLLCLFGFNKYNRTRILVIWNPCIRKSFGIHVVSNINSYFGFGVCPVTRDPTVVCVSLPADDTPLRVEVFTLSSGVWNVIPSGNLPQSVTFKLTNHVVIDRFIYWGANESTRTHDGVFTVNDMLVSFDFITKEFKVIDLPDALTKPLYSCCCVSKLRESLVVYGSAFVNGGGECCSAWVMEHDSSFTKLFTIGVRVEKIILFKKNGETILETLKEEGGTCTTLDVYYPCSQHIKNLGISGGRRSFFMGSYKESLLLLDHLDSRVYSGNNF